ncbi:potassium-transporting ATPase KdpC subunit [Dyadobacter endophyticus]|uniref:Potassium-transporting ATPase KdpC subunit n=1 Tax=Dyadobacter endophyticus TaxID=1749036 RepID=A0ABQ1YGC6_9BACT|nr:K(+)-transporting ATPase subunit C [Dyadobacter endophyticus]GGH23719.1 potassium-transporting ATPase KdpC subunit [Dyadobacter endophyticus]
MKQHILSAIRLTIVTLIFFSGVYTLVILGIAQLFPNHGKGEIIEQNGKRYYTNIGQSFTDDKYFNSRPSAVGYNAAGSGGSNKGPSNEEYLGVVQARIDTFLLHNPGVQKADIPVELVTASGSGLDPDISEKAALVQVKRIAKLRNLPEQKLQQLVKEHIEGPLLGLFGPTKINVLKLNLALENLR